MFWSLMYNFHFAKVVAGVGPLLAKETILSKIVNMVDVFKISLSQWFDDNNKKYIETVMKLDNSKTIMFETKGRDLRVKNLGEVSLKKWQAFAVDYSEYAQEWSHKLFIDYSWVNELPKWAIIACKQSGVQLEVQEVKEDEALCKVLQWGTILPYDSIVFEKYEATNYFLTERDKKDLLRWLEHGIHIISAANTKTAEDIQHIKTFLTTQQQATMKVFAKIETAESIKNIQEIIDTADGIILSVDVVDPYLKAAKKDVFEIIHMCKKIGKPIFIHYVYGVQGKDYPLLQKKVLQSYCNVAVDGYMIETMIHEEDPLRICSTMFETLSEISAKAEKSTLEEFYKWSDFIIRDYIIHNAYRITEELDVRAIVCFTHNGYTPARLASLHPWVPIIAFSSIDTTYRYINTLRWVKWFKISPNFNYQNLKRIGKEMIRIIFKGNISLDDKIVIVQANEIAKDEKTDMINGVELYKFKNI